MEELRILLGMGSLPLRVFLCCSIHKTTTSNNGFTSTGKNLWHFYFVLLAPSGVWLLFNGLLALLFSLFYVIREFDKFLHRGWAQITVLADKT